MNTRKKRVMRCQMSRGQALDSRNHTCSVCRHGLGCNSIVCVACHGWVHMEFAVASQVD